MIIYFLQYERDQHCRSSSSPNYSVNNNAKKWRKKKKKSPQHIHVYHAVRIVDQHYYI